MEKSKPRILIVEDGKGVARMYAELLSADYAITVCHSGAEAQSLIDQKERFDLAIMDMVLPPENMRRFTLDDCQKTGLRLMEQMMHTGLCSRFYVMTVVKDLKDEVYELCCQHKAVCRFEYKLDSEPEELAENIRRLLTTARPPGTPWTLDGLRRALRETTEYLALCRELAVTRGRLDSGQTARLAAAMTWLFEALDNPAFTDFFRESVLTNPKVRQTWAKWLQALEEIRILLERRFEPYTQGELHSEIEGAIAAILAFSAEFKLPVMA